MGQSLALCTLNLSTFNDWSPHNDILSKKLTARENQFCEYLIFVFVVICSNESINCARLLVKHMAVLDLNQ